MSFLNPIWLWGMMGLMIPIAIHLLSRKEGKVIPMGSLRFLNESPTAQFRHIRLNEIALLLLRCLLLAIIVFLLAGLRIDGLVKKKQKWLVLENGVQNSEWKNIIDSLSEAGFEKRLLANTFPPFTEAIDSSATIHYWSALDNLQQADLDSAIVISYNLATNFNGERIPLPENIHWITTDPQEKKQFIATAIEMTNDSVWTRSGTTTTTRTEFETSIRNADHVSKIVADTIEISIFSDQEYEFDKKVIVAALLAIETSSPHHFKVSTKPISDFKQPNSGWVIWLSSKKMPSSNLRFLSLRSGLDENLALIENGAKLTLQDSTIRATDWIITKRLSQENALSENLTLGLAELFQADSNRHVLVDYRTIPNELAWSKLGKIDNGSSVTNDDLITKILTLLLILTLLAERTLSFKRNQ